MKLYVWNVIFYVGTVSVNEATYSICLNSKKHLVVSEQSFSTLEIIRVVFIFFIRNITLVLKRWGIDWRTKYTRYLLKTKYMLPHTYPTRF